MEARRLLSASLLDINTVGGASNPSSLINVNGTLYFTADDGTHGRELWRTDGTAAGTRMVKDILPGSAGGLANFPSSQIANINGTIFFSANNGIHGEELWRSDGTAAGTVMVKDIMPGAGDGLDIYQNTFTNVNGTLYFSATHPTLGRELWKSDGTAAGTVLIKDIAHGSGWSQPAEVTNVNGTVFFTAVDRDAGGVSHGRELWKTNGTAAGTVMVTDIYPGDDGIFDPRPEDLMNFGGTLYFTANAGPVTGEELWRSDGTAAGTYMVLDLDPGLYHSSQPSGMTEFNGMLYFWARGATTGLGLWKTNGTAAGTQLVSTNPVSSGGLTIVGNQMYFAAINALGGFDLCKTDGTTAGTVRITEIFTRQEVQERIYTLNASLTNIRGTLYLAGSRGTSGVELLTSDGTAAGTRLVADIAPGSPSSDPTSITEVNGKLVFTANAGSGIGLWVMQLDDDDNDHLPVRPKRPLLDLA